MRDSARALIGVAALSFVAGCGVGSTPSNSASADGGEPAGSDGGIPGGEGGVAIDDGGAPEGNTEGNSPVDASGGDAMPVHVVGACANLAAAGVLENVTPSQLNPQSWCWPGSTGCSGANSTYGAHFFVLDPNHSGTILLGTSSLGIWKSTDCGMTWVHIDTGTAGPALDTGRNWSIVIDPTDSNVVYTCAGYGGVASGVSSLGVFKSTDGGVNWQQLLPQAMLDTVAGGFVEKIAMDPTNHLHLLASFHGACKNAPNDGGSWGCLAETHDAGSTWTLAPSAESWSEGDGQTIVDDKTWFFGSLFGSSTSAGGIWRTTNGGASWDNVYVGSASGAVFTAPDGTFFSAGGNGMLHSADGLHWSALANSPSGASVNGSDPVATDGTNLYTSGGAYGGTEPAQGWYSSARLNQLTSWAPAFGYVKMVAGAENLAYDADHHLLYSSNLTAGIWRVVVP